MNDEARMQNAEGWVRMPKREYNLEDRTAIFGEAVIAFAKQIRVSPVTVPLIDQLVRSATSIGANYSEADDAESKKDFRHKIGICRKESKESKHWLRMVAAAEESLKEEARDLYREATELNRIFGAIRRSCDE
jgi:four helix bundle protein